MLFLVAHVGLILSAVVIYQRVLTNFMIWKMSEGSFVNCELFGLSVRFSHNSVCYWDVTRLSGNHWRVLAVYSWKRNDSSARMPRSRSVNLRIVWEITRTNLRRPNRVCVSVVILWSCLNMFWMYNYVLLLQTYYGVCAVVFFLLYFIHNFAFSI